MAKLTQTELRAFSEDIVISINEKVEKHNSTIETSKKYKEGLKKLEDKYGITEGKKILEKFNKKFKQFGVKLQLNEGNSWKNLDEAATKIEEFKESQIKNSLNFKDLNKIQRKLTMAQAGNKALDKICEDIKKEFEKSLGL